MPLSVDQLNAAIRDGYIALSDIREEAVSRVRGLNTSHVLIDEPVDWHNEFNATTRDPATGLWVPLGPVTSVELVPSVDGGPVGVSIGRSYSFPPADDDSDLDGPPLVLPYITGFENLLMDSPLDRFEGQMAGQIAAGLGIPSAALGSRTIHGTATFEATAYGREMLAGLLQESASASATNVAVVQSNAGAITLESLQDAFFAIAEQTANYPTHIAMHPRVAREFREMVGLNAAFDGSTMSSMYGMKVEIDPTMPVTEVRIGNGHITNLKAPEVQAIAGWDLIPEPYRSGFPKSMFFFNFNAHLDFLFACLESAKNLRVVVICPLGSAKTKRTRLEFWEECARRGVQVAAIGVVEFVAASEFHRFQEGCTWPDFIIVKELTEELR